MHMIDESCTPSIPASKSLLLMVRAFVASIFRTRLNRRQVARLEHMSDAELRDIGLSRLDLNIAIGESRFFEDPSRLLRRTKLPRS